MRRRADEHLARTEIRQLGLAAEVRNGIQLVRTGNDQPEPFFRTTSCRLVETGKDGAGYDPAKLIESARGAVGVR